MNTDALVFALFAFLLGSIPFSVIIGKVGLKKDIRTVGDGNPGAFNVLRAGGVAWGGLAIFLDVCKAALPVGLATHIFKFDGWYLVLIAIAPVFGHAFSPFLRFKGGKAIASMGGVTIGFSILSMPVILMISLIGFYITLTSSGWAVMFTWAVGVIFLLVTSAPWAWLITWGILGVLTVYKHRAELRHAPKLKPTSSKRH
ncbi:MAG: glycerol-3-phosphate acyltransferase [Phototrophicales bacterium]|nr:glycerol-3-phosphate acyltransferase [Phototrophicales bacterium]